MTRGERDDAQLWVTLLAVSLAVALCLAWMAPVVEWVAPNPNPGMGASTAGAKSPCGNCGVIEEVRELRAAASRQEGTPQAGGRAGVVMIILGALGGKFRIDPAKIYEVEVRMQDGSVRTFQSTTAPARKRGDRVRVVGGRIAQIS
jgi:hypothetical protein